MRTCHASQPSAIQAAVTATNIVLSENRNEGRLGTGVMTILPRQQASRDTRADSEKGGDKYPMDIDKAFTKDEEDSAGVNE